LSEPARFIPITKPWIGGEEAEAVRRPLLSGWVTQGPEVAAFEKEFADFVGAPFACAVSNCTTALHLALRAIGAGPGDEVITVSHSFIATASVIRYCGAVPVFLDIQPTTFNMDPDLVGRAITPKTRAILCVHQMGLPCDLRAILEIAALHGLPVVEDAACAIGSEILWEDRWDRIGKPHGDIACFSFHPRKLITTGDGGMLTTSSQELDRKFRLWRQHGMSLPDTARHSSRKVAFESYAELGYNYRLTDLQAAVGREQLKRLPEIVRRRRELASQYRNLLETIPGLRLPEEPAWARSNWQSFCVGLPEGRDQAEVMQALLDEGIATRRGIMCAHREPAYPPGTWSCGVPHAEGDCPAHSCLSKSEAAQDRTILLPLYHGITCDEQEFVAARLRKVLQTAT
jgi:dTDP-4-amino-4,6-dideoxygalactose transaminase